MKSLWVICSGEFLFFLVLYFIAYYSHWQNDVLGSDQFLGFNLTFFFSSDKAAAHLSGVLSKNCRILLSVHAFSLWLWEL